MTDFIASEFENVSLYGQDVLGFGGALKQDVNKDWFAVLEAGVAIASGQSPEIASVTALSSTSIRVNFVYPANDNAALSAASNYLISPSLTVEAVTPEAVVNPTYVVLTVSEQKQGESYTVTLQRLVRA
jgi:hypothetical protein